LYLYCTFTDLEGKELSNDFAIFLLCSLLSLHGYLHHIKTCLVVLCGSGDGDGDRGVVGMACPIGDRGGTGDREERRGDRGMTGDRIDGDLDI
jgi:hypothetical protein